MPGLNPTVETFVTGRDLRTRYLTPLEYERLQDDFTRIAYGGKSAEECPDPLRYGALGNSMAVPCVSWIGRRIRGGLRARLAHHLEPTVGSPLAPIDIRR